MTLADRLFMEIDKLKERIVLLEFNNKGLGESCEKHMLTIDELKISLRDISARAKRARDILQSSKTSPGNWFMLSTAEQEALLERIKKNENIYSSMV